MEQGSEVQASGAMNIPMRKQSAFHIDRQESLVTEKFSKNGRLMDLHLVAKNVGFNVFLNAGFDMNQSPPTAKLLYDWDDEMGEDKEVEQLKTPPLEIIAHVDRSGRKANVEAKISVLSSQHERAFFRIKFNVEDRASGEQFYDYSQPIKVIAKRNQIRKMLERKLQTQVKNENATVNTPVGVVNLAQLAPKRERPTQDAILESLHRIEEQQLEQFRFMQEIAEKAVRNPTAAGSKDGTSQPSPSIPDFNDEDFEGSFGIFLAAFEKVAPEERPNKMRKLMSSMDKGKVRSADEFVKLYNMESGMPQLEDIPPSCGYCPDLHCPHKTELEMLNSLYNDFLKDPDSSPELT